ncbi:MAG: hypothetical protein N2Z62_08885 [Rhodobacteraceae bacterium]|nr:hypothetical protein [Paracoccaceae bacterium]
MRPALALCLVTLLAACADTRTACLDRASAELRAIDAEIAEIELALARGYRVSGGATVTAGLSVCTGDSPVTVCLGGSRPISERTVAIDRRSEEARLRALRSARPEAAARAERAAAACPPA